MTPFQPAAASIAADREAAHVADPCTFIIFGALGDLAMRKLAPALHNPAEAGLLNERFTLFGVGRDALSPEQYRQKLEDDLRHFSQAFIPGAQPALIVQRAAYVTGEFDDGRTFERDRLGQYRAGSRGPAEADALLARDGRTWHQPGV